MRVAIEEGGEEVEACGGDLKHSVGVGALLAGMLDEFLRVDVVNVLHDN